MSGLACIVLAAGKGTRMRSGLPKVLHPLAGRPMVEHVLASARALAPARTVLVIGPELEAAAAGLEGGGEAFACVVQEEPLGTAHAVAQTRSLLEDFDGDVLVLYADTPLVRAETLERLIQARRDGPGVAAAVLGFRRRNRRSTAGSSWRRTGRSHASSSTPRPTKRSVRSRSATPA